MRYNQRCVWYSNSLNNKSDNAYLKTWNNCIPIFFTYIQYMCRYISPQSL